LRRFPSVHRADQERQQRVRLDPFAAPFGYDRYLRIPLKQAVKYFV